MTTSSTIDRPLVAERELDAPDADDVIDWLRNQTGGTLGERQMRARAIELLEGGNQ